MSVTQVLQQSLVNLSNTLSGIYPEAVAIAKAYFATTVSADISGVGSGATAVTVASKLTKTQYVNGYTMCEKVQAFFENAAVAQGDYAATCYNLLYGNTAASVPLSIPVESLGDRMKSLSGSILVAFDMAKAILDIYTDNQIGDAIGGNGAVDDERIVFGATMTKALMLSGITLAEQFKKMINNEAVSTGDYAATLAKWKVI